MLRDEGVAVESVWTGVDGSSERKCELQREVHRDIDRELRRIARRRATLDAEEARWLREAERHRIWRKLGFATALEYLEDVFGHAPRTAKDRLRVAKALGELPGLEAELRSGAMPYSAVKELTRVMTPATEAQWLACARGRNLRDIEELVEGRRKGDLPGDPKDPSLITRDVVFTLDARRQALLQQARAMFEAERGESVDNAALLEALCMAALQTGVQHIGSTMTGSTMTGSTMTGSTMTGSTMTGSTMAGSTMTGSTVASRDAIDAMPTAGVRTKAPRPAYQIVVRKCDDCARAWMPGRGQLLEIRRADLGIAACDAEIVDEAKVAAAQTAGKRRPRPISTIPAKTRDLVWARDAGRCRFPGCRATRHLELHHIVFQEHGGSHDASNLLVLCDGHHKQLHDGHATISGRAPDDLVFVRDGRRLADSRAPSEQQAAARLGDLATSTPRLGALAMLTPRLGDRRRGDLATSPPLLDDLATPAPLHARPATRTASRFDDVVELEAAKQVLRQLGYKTRDAHRALAQVRAHVGTDADVPTLVRAVLDVTRRESHVRRTDGESTASLATRALIQAGFSAALAGKAVTKACAHVGTAELATLIKEALRHCRER